MTRGTESPAGQPPPNPVYAEWRDSPASSVLMKSNNRAAQLQQVSGRNTPQRVRPGHDNGAREENPSGAAPIDWKFWPVAHSTERWSAATEADAEAHRTPAVMELTC